MKIIYRKRLKKKFNEKASRINETLKELTDLDDENGNKLTRNKIIDIMYYSDIFHNEPNYKYKKTYNYFISDPLRKMNFEMAFRETLFDLSSKIIDLSLLINEIYLLLKEKLNEVSV